jgi:lysophospholipase L1-like esterase
VALTKVQIRGHYEDAAGVPQRGTVTLTLSGPIANGATSVTPTPIQLDIDSNGNISKLLDALDDAGTTPPGRVYNVVESITVTDGTPVETSYSITVSTADAAAGIDLGTAARYSTAPVYTPVPLSQATADARYAQLTRSPRGDLGIYVPPGWGATWRARLAVAKAGTGKATLATIGASSTQGYYSSDLRHKGWVDLLRASLQTTYGDGGDGYWTSSLSSVFQTANSIPAGAQSAYAAKGNLVSTSGTWQAGGSDYGPGAYYIFTSASGATATWTVRGTTVSIYNLDAGGNHANWSYSIDGGTAVNVTDGGAGAQNVRKTTISGLSAGTHTVTLTYAGTGSNYLSVCGVSGENASGVVVNNLARYGSRAGNFGNVDQSLAAPWMAGPSYPADLVLLTHGPNDAVNSDSGDTWAKNTRRIMGTVREGYPGADLMIVLPHVGKYDTSTYLYQDYAYRARGLAEAFGAALVDFWTLGRNSWAYWNGLNYWGDSSNPGATGTDNVHPSDAGHAYIASVLLPILTS